MLSKLFKLKDWFTLNETARHLSINFGEEVTEADVLRLALDGRLVLSVNLANSAMGLCGKVVPIGEVEFEEIEFVKGDPPTKIYGGIVLHTGNEETHVLKFEGEAVRLRGVYDLPMIGGEKFEVENQYQELVGGPRISMMSIDGSFVQANEDVIQILEDFDDNEFQSGSTAQRHKLEDFIARENLCDDDARELLLKHKADRAEFLKKDRNDPSRYYPAVGLGGDVVFVVRNDSLTKFIQEVTAEDGESSDKSARDKPLSSRERDTLLTIIAALCKDAGYDYSKHAKTAGLIQSTASIMGVSIGETTIEGHLKKIPDALGTRMK